MQIKSMSADRGMSWLVEGFDYFKRSPGAWIGVTAVMIVGFLIISIIPFGGLVLELLWPVFVGGMMLGCQAQDEGQPFQFSHLFDGFAIGGTALYVVGALYLAGMILIAILVIGGAFVAVGGMAFFDTLMSGDSNAIAANLLNVLLVLLVFLALLLPLIMAVWFAPALVILHGCTATHAMSLSFQGCLANIVPFLVYGIVGLVLAFVATIPFMLGWLVLMPVITASMWVGCKEIYSAEPK